MPSPAAPALPGPAATLPPARPPGLALRLLVGLYRLAWYPALPLVLGYFLWRGRQDRGYLRHWNERLGAGPAPDGAVWVHAVSLGEMRSAVPLVRALLARGERVVTTHLTPAGRAAAEAAFAAEIAAGQVTVRWLPLDAGFAWARLLRRVRPKLMLALEIEIWPGMTDACRRAGVALVLANSQLPARSFARDRRAAGWIGHPVGWVPLVLAKSGLQAARFRALGAPRVEAAGELRFDQPVPEAQLAAAAALRPALAGRPVVTVASVVAGEDATYLAAFRALRDAGLRPLLVYVPRAPERFEATAALLAAQGLGVLRRSQALGPGLEPRPGADLAAADVLLGDSFGEMYFYLALGDLAVVGGGFVPKGAHNVIEPLALGRPVLVGPHVWTIEYPGQEAMAAGVVTLCADAEALGAALRGLLAEPARMAAQAAEARRFLAAHAGATARIMAALAPLLGREGACG